MPFLENRDRKYLRDRGMIVIFKNFLSQGYRQKMAGNHNALCKRT